ncbi:MAG TPA: putative glycoside hydrolase [Marinagarivorans sp.]
MTAFNNGHLHFDIRAVDFADNINGLALTLSCGGDCRSNAVGVNLSQLGQWQHISIPIKALIDEGLEISQIYTGFEIQPVEGE